MPVAFGSIILESNGLSYVKFDLQVDIYKINESKIEDRFVFSESIVSQL